jgi:hypothetical protein
MSVEISLSGPGIANHDGGRPHPATIAARNRKVVNESRYVRDESSNFVRLALGEPESDRTCSRAGVPGPAPVQKEFAEHFAVPVLHDVFRPKNIRPAVVPARVVSMTIRAVGVVSLLSAFNCSFVTRRTSRESASATPAKIGASAVSAGAGLWRIVGNHAARLDLTLRENDCSRAGS